jgi:hypothetical protein
MKAQRGSRRQLRQPWVLTLCFPPSRKLQPDVSDNVPRPTIKTGQSKTPTALIDVQRSKPSLSCLSLRARLGQSSVDHSSSPPVAQGCLAAQSEAWERHGQDGHGWTSAGRVALQPRSWDRDQRDQRQQGHFCGLGRSGVG